MRIQITGLRLRIEDGTWIRMGPLLKQFDLLRVLAQSSRRWIARKEGKKARTSRFQASADAPCSDRIFSFGQL